VPRNRKQINAGTVEHTKKVAEALDMVRQGGFTWDQIAAQVGYANRGTAYKAVKDELNRMTSEPAAEVVKLELARLEALQAALWPRAMLGNPKVQAAAVGKILGVMGRRAKLLGLDDFERRSIELAEQRHALNEEQARITFEFMNRVMNQMSLTPEQRELLPEIIAGELASITDGKVPDG
jgi:transposase-like protein